MPEVVGFPGLERKRHCGGKPVVDLDRQTWDFCVNLNHNSECGVTFVLLCDRAGRLAFRMLVCHSSNGNSSLPRPS